MRIWDGQDLLGSYEFMMEFDAVPVDVQEAEGGVLDLPPKEETLDSFLGQDGLKDFLERCVRRRRRVFWMHSLFEGDNGKFGRNRHLDRVGVCLGGGVLGFNVNGGRETCGMMKRTEGQKLVVGMISRWWESTCWWPHRKWDTAKSVMPPQLVEMWEKQASGRHTNKSASSRGTRGTSEAEVELRPTVGPTVRYHQRRFPIWAPRRHVVNL